MRMNTSSTQEKINYFYKGKAIAWQNRTAEMMESFHQIDTDRNQLLSNNELEAAPRGRGGKL